MARVAVLGAGGPAGVNALRALKMAGHECVAVDDNPAHLAWCKRYAEVRETFADDVDVVIPQPDKLVHRLVSGPEIKAKTLLPRREVVEWCQDKLVASDRWDEFGLRKLGPVLLQEPWPDYLGIARDRLGRPFWLRARKGAGAKGAILVSELEQGYHWIRFWQSRGEDFGWIAEEYLPGRDYAWSSIWCEGSLVTSFARERLEYLYPHLTPEGLTGTPTIARIVHDARVNEVAYDAVTAIDDRPHGIYSVDLREDAEGYPRPTEINAGRGFTTFGLWSMYDVNYLDLVVHLALGQVGAFGTFDAGRAFRKFDDLPDGLTLKRHIDCGHVFDRAPLLLCA